MRVAVLMATGKRMNWTEDTFKLEGVQRGMRIEFVAPVAYSCYLYIDTLTNDEPVYMAACPELPGAIAQGESQQQAIDYLFDDVIPAYLEHLRVFDLDVPLPGSHIETFTR